MKKRLAIFLASMLFVGVQLIQAQTTRITGTVTSSEDGMPLPGVSVVIKGTSIGTATDVDGKYELNAPANSETLTVSFIGYVPQEIAIAGRAVIDVVMAPDTKQIEEVIVVAYGTTTKSSFTGSAGTVKSEELQKRQVSNISNAMAGQVAGVQVTSSSGQPGTSANIRIRGIGSMNSVNTPLYVVDGVPFEGSISSINPQDIETMTVLKDAAANALYGARGANGVILITTKKGKGKEALITVDSKWGNNSRAVPKYDVMDDPAMYYETYYKALYNSFVNSGYSAQQSYTFADAALFDTDAGGLGYQIYTVPAGERFIGTNFKLNPNATLGYADADYYYTSDDWYDEIFKSNNMRQEYNVSVSGSSDKFNYYFSAGMLDDEGIVAGSGFERFTGRSNISYDAKSWLKIGANIGYSNYNFKSPGSQTSWGSSGNLFYVTNNIAPVYPMYVRNADGSIKKDQRGITVYDFGNSTNFKRAFMALANPAITLQLDKYNNIYDELNSKWFAIFTPIKDLTFTVNFGANVLNNRENNLYNPFYGSSVGSQGSVYVSHYRQMAINQQYLLNYKKTFSDVHNIELLAGYESYERKMQSLYGQNNMLYNPFIGELNNAIQTPPVDMGSYTHMYTNQGYLTRLQYDYDGKYFASASYRRDASSRFHPDNRWGNFGSLGAAWLVSKEDFLSDLTWIDLLKVKASYGIQGNDNLGTSSNFYYAYLDQFTVTESDGDFAVAFAFKGNKDITWETSYSTNVGFDFELFKSRLNGTVEYFNRKTADQLYNLRVPLSLGYSTIPINVGDVSNRGIEVDVNGIIFKNSKIEWSANFNATHFKNEILSLHPTVEKTGVLMPSSIWEIGGTIYDLYMRKYAGVDKETGKALYYLDPDKGDYTTTDVYTDAQKARLGGTLPDVYGGFGTSARAFGFDFSVQFSYQLGGRLYDGSYEALMHNGDNAGHNWHKDILNAWTPENRNTNVPRLSNLDESYQLQSSRFLVSSNYLSLNSVVLGYTLPESILKKVKISSLRVYVAGDNLALFTKRQGLDPRQYFGGGSSTTTGNFAYSALRTLSGGVTITF